MNNHVSLTEDSSENSNTNSSRDNQESNEQRHISRSGNSTRGLKRDSALKDQQSTGRKRAARMYPLHREAPCEWRGKANCGGGPYPIIGCISGLQEARHHGPDKNVSNNEEGNVHRICHFCHYNWHAKNNADYDWNSTSVNPHNPRQALEQELQEAALNELRYRSGKKVKIKD